MPDALQTAPPTPQPLPEIQTFPDTPARDRLTAVAIKAFKALCTQWHPTGAESAALLGVSESTWDRIKRKPAAQTLRRTNSPESPPSPASTRA